MADQYVEETKRRYKKDRMRLNEVEFQIKELQEEASTLDSRLSAYGRILRHEIGQEAFEKLKNEIDSEGKLKDTQESNEVSVSDTTITQTILSAIQKAGKEGITAGEVISDAQSHGFGPERRNTIYATLNRLRNSNKIKKVGPRYLVA